jgi:ribosomal protein S18 acetylase RimI-like enzyme
VVAHREALGREGRPLSVRARAVLALRPMAEADFAAFAEREAAQYALDKVRSFSWPAEGAPERARREFATFLPEGVRTPGQGLYDLVSEGSGETVGQLWLELESAREPGTAFVYLIHIVPHQRRRGLGRAAMALAEQEALRHGCREMRLHVFGFNEAAISLYRGIGYDFVDMLMRKPL